MYISKEALRPFSMSPLNLQTRLHTPVCARLHHIIMEKYRIETIIVDFIGIQEEKNENIFQCNISRYSCLLDVHAGFKILVHLVYIHIYFCLAL